MPIKKTTKPNEVRERDYNAGFQFDNFAKKCGENRYVLVIGPEAVLNMAENIEAHGDSQNLLFNLTVEYLHDHGIAVGNNNNFTELSLDIANLHAKVLDTIDGLDFTASFDQEIEPSLLKLLKTKCFRLVLTTTVDPYLEIAMEKVWGKNGFRVMDFYGSVKDFPRDEQNLNEFNEFVPTLYYVFGKADTERRDKKFVLTENDAMCVIEGWLSKTKVQNLLTYIHDNKNYIVTVGCKFDDWLFRFFWYILIGNVNELSTRGQVAIELANEDPLRIYLQREHVHIFNSSRKFMEQAAESINRYSPACQTGGIFISYAHEDKYIALPLFNRLVREGFSVWMDERLQAANEYDERIQEAINSCTIFMPILSSQVKRDLEGGIRRYYMQEWKWAQARYAQVKSIDPQAGNIRVMPLLTGSYDIRGTYHQKIEECIKQVTAYDLKNGIEGLINHVRNL